MEYQNTLKSPYTSPSWVSDLWAVYWKHFGPIWLGCSRITLPDSKIHGANVGPTWGCQDPGVPHIDHTSLLSGLYFHNLGPIVFYHYRPVSQMQVPLATCLEPVLHHNTLPKLLYVFEHKTKYVLIHAPHTRIVVFWHISNIPPMILESQICCNTARFYIAAIFVKYCYTTGSWLL